MTTPERADVLLTRRRVLALGALLPLAFAGCSAADPTVGSAVLPSPTQTPGVPPQALRSDVRRGPAGVPAAAQQALHTFGTQLLLRLPADQNAVLSPYSIYAVLAMARAGAKGRTATQLDAVLGAADTQAGHLTAIDDGLAAARAAGLPPTGRAAGTTDPRPVTIEVANSLFSALRLPVRQPYLDALAAGFGVGMYQLDYAADPEAARSAINSWVAGHTHSLIPELLGAGVITKDTVLTLVNAVYLSAPWARPFTAAAKPIDFTTAAGRRTSAPAMRPNGSVSGNLGTGWSSVTLPYRGHRLAMTLVLPDRGSFAEVRRQLPVVFRAATATSGSRLVVPTVPTFKSQTHLSLVRTMEALGVSDLFDPRADLSGITGQPGDLKAADIIHQAVLTIDEKGTEAAAATAMVGVGGSAMSQEPEKMVLDRPFLYCVHDTTTMAPLFLGQVVDPTS